MTLAPLPPFDYYVGASDGTVLLDLNDGTVITTAFDPGSPDAREVTVDRTGGDGQVDTTQFHGARPVAWTGQYMGDAASLLRFHTRLRALCHPGNRFYFYFTDADGLRRVLVRSDTTSTPWSNDQVVTAAWRGIDGVLEDAALYEYNFLTDSGSGVSGGAGPLRVPFNVPASISGTSGTTTSSTSGLPFPFHFPFGFRGNVTGGTTTGGGSSDPSTGALIINNPGTTVTPPVFRIYGPCVGPQIVCVTTGVRMSWPDLSLNAGDYLNVDCKEKESTLGGDPNSPQGFDFNASDWPVVPVGDSQWQLFAASNAAGWGAVMDVRFRWL